ncbi:MAG: helix-turn-helix transcriptional regulator [Pseudomonadota bacterium]
MQPETDIVSALRLAGVTVGLVCFVTFYVQRRLHPLFAASAVMFLAFSLSYLDHLARAFLPGLPASHYHRIHMVAYAASFVVLPAFYLKYKLLRNLRHEVTRAELARHGAIPLIAGLCALIGALIPSELLVEAQQETVPAPLPLWVMVSIGSLMILEPVAYLQWIFYTILIAWTHWRGRAELKRRFGSDARTESAWIYAMVLVLCIYTSVVMVSFVLRITAGTAILTPAFDGVMVLAFMLLVAINSLRQTPGPIGWTSGKPPTQGANGAGQKYSKSALAAEHADRIARKLTAAMRDDTLYRDANLSLTKLAQHINASPNYVSQTLNEHVNRSFFDFVNEWRINEAKKLLLENPEDTILAITYEVGFNSRSAFYTAFKKETGITPSQYRRHEGATQLRSNTSSGLSTRHA